MRVSTRGFISHNPNRISRQNIQIKKKLKIEDLEIWFRVTDINVKKYFHKEKTFYSNLRAYRSRGGRGNFFTVTNYNFHYWSLLKELQIRC